MEDPVRSMLPLIVVGVIFVAAFLLRSKATKLTSASDLDSRIGLGKPLVLQFFSNM